MNNKNAYKKTSLFDETNKKVKVNVKLERGVKWHKKGCLIKE